MNVLRHWVWRRRRNQDHGYWEDIASGERVGPIPLDENGRAAFVPADDHQGAVDLIRELSTMRDPSSYMTSNTEAAMRSRARAWLREHDAAGGQ